MQMFPHLISSIFQNRFMQTENSKIGITPNGSRKKDGLDDAESGWKEEEWRHPP